jgi:hypothetical protein
MDEERDSCGRPVEWIKEQTLRYMNRRGCREDYARSVVEAQYDCDVEIFRDIDAQIAKDK